MHPRELPHNPGGCYLCESDGTVLHHISYDPERVILVCQHHHNLVHSNGYDGKPLYPDLQPDMKRREWADEYFEWQKPPSPLKEEIEWEDEIGAVKR